MKKSMAILLVLLCFSLACKVNHLADIHSINTRLDEKSSSITALRIDSMIQPYKIKLEVEMNEVIGEAAIDLVKSRPECTMGNWFADLLYEETDRHLDEALDFAIINYGGMRIRAIPRGPITRSKIYELMPFENVIVVVFLNSTNLKIFIDHMAAKGGWPASKQLRYDIYRGKAQNIRINEKPIDPDKIYAVSISDYLANGGGGCDFFQASNQKNLGILVRQATLDHIEKDTWQGIKQEAKLEGRIRFLDDN